jgi:hypothetical protein
MEGLPVAGRLLEICFPLVCRVATALATASTAVRLPHRRECQLLPHSTQWPLHFFRRVHAARRFGFFPLPKLYVIDLWQGDIPAGFVESCLRCFSRMRVPLLLLPAPNPLFEFVG